MQAGAAVLAHQLSPEQPPVSTSTPDPSLLDSIGLRPKMGMAILIDRIATGRSQG
jgi:hypothetical protein